MTDLDLPRLSSAELVARFGDDQAALRRYRMLVALIREGRPTAEVARTFDVSRESLRRLRNAFASEGLAALSTRRRGGGHLNRGSPLAAIVRQELQAEPGLPTATLWRRVQAQLAQAGIDAPRSTFYRLLNRLRGDETPGRPSTNLLRDALGALVEDPPLALGRSALANLLLPDMREPLQRGRRMQRAIRAAIERLRPSEAGPVLDDPRWRHYLIVAGEYETGEKRQALQSALALSASTYSRAKREALERLVELLPVALGELPPTAPPADLFAPPAAPNDFDYDAELDRYMARLRRGGMALIWGPAGVGKVGLALTLAHRLQARGQKVVWYACTPPDIDTAPGPGLLVTIAAALALDGQGELWDTISSNEPAAMAARFETLAAGLVGRHWTVIIANAHWLAGGEAARVMDALTAAQELRHLRLVLVGRDLPIWADAERWPPLPFPSDATARQSFLRRMSDDPAQRVAPPTLALGTLRDRVIDLVAAVPVELLETLPAEEISQILATLRPTEQLSAELRAALERAGARPRVDDTMTR